MTIKTTDEKIKGVISYAQFLGWMIGVIVTCTSFFIAVKIKGDRNGTDIDKLEIWKEKHTDKEDLRYKEMYDLLNKIDKKIKD